MTCKCRKEYDPSRMFHVRVGNLCTECKDKARQELKARAAEDARQFAIAQLEDAASHERGRLMREAFQSDSKQITDFVLSDHFLLTIDMVDFAARIRAFKAES